MKSQGFGKIFLVLIFLLVFIAALIISFLVTKNYFSGKSVESASAVLASMPTKSPEAKAKTYSNEIYGFSFGYPADWQEQKMTASAANKDLIFQVGFKQAATQILNTSNPDPQNQNSAGQTPEIKNPKNLYLKIYEPKENTVLEDWIQAKFRDFKLVSEAKIANQESYGGTLGVAENYGFAYFLTKNDFIFEFGTNFNDNTEQNDFLKNLAENFTLTL